MLDLYALEVSMDGVTVPLTTPYGPLEVRILAGPTLAPGAHVTEHTFEDRDNGYRPVEVPAHVYAVAETSGYGAAPELTIHDALTLAPTLSDAILNKGAATR